MTFLQPRRNRSTNDEVLTGTGADGPRRLLDGLQANVLVADRELHLVYVNETARRALAAIEPDLVKAFGVRVSDLLGGSIHRFHRDPARVQRVLESAPMPHRATFSFGGVTLSTQITRVHDAGGSVVGYSVVWDNVTRQAQLEAALASAVATLNTTSTDLSSSSATLSAAVGDASSEASAVAVATEQLSATLREVSRNTSLAVATADDASAAAAHAADRVTELLAASGEVRQVVALIEGIAQQTNLLALNATIEAARAGESGKGFAVVAAEVKQLSDSTRSGTSQIATITEQVGDLSAKVAEALDAIRTAVAAICDQQHAISAAVEQQAAATNEISHSVGRVAAASATSAEQTDHILAASTALSTNARQVQDLLGRDAASR